MKTRDVQFDDPSRAPVERRDAKPAQRLQEFPFEALACGHGSPADQRSRALEEMITKQSAEINLRCAQVADLYNLQQRQANELQVACEEIDRLSGTISTLLENSAQHETEMKMAKNK